jgi:hypothetical protein
VKKLILLLSLLLGCTPAVAGVPCALPFNLQNGQPADATQVMANYNALVTCLGNAAAAGTNSDITSLSGLTSGLPAVLPHAVSSVYTVAAADCGKVLSLGGGAFYTVTFGVTSVFTAGCTVIVLNADTVRGKGIVINGQPTVRLFPLQAITLTQNSGTWVVSPQSQVWNNPGTFFVSLAGSDDPTISDCLATGAGACATAANLLAAPGGIIPNLVHGNIGGTIIQYDCASGTFTEQIPTIARTAEKLIRFIGNDVNPVSCQYILPSNGTILDVQDGAQVEMTGFTLGRAAGTGVLVNARQFALLDLTNVIFANNANGNNVTVSDLSSVNFSNISVAAPASSLVLASGKSAVQVNGITVPASASVSMIAWFIANDAEIAGAPNWSVSGAVSGPRFACSLNAVINFSTPYPPALTAGTAVTGCQTIP